VCANIEDDAKQTLTAVATFTYPIAGKIIFRQEADDPFADTTVAVEGLVYSDGSKNDTFNHKWHVHVDVPGKDYFNWTGRCLSAKEHFNPYGVDTEDSMYNDCRNEHVSLKCELGDLESKLGLLSLVGRKRNVKSSWRLYTDTNLPLSGPLSVIGRSIVIHDDKAPEHRGNRLACTGIVRQYRHKAVARQWFGNGVRPPPVKGRLEFIQDTDRSITHSLVDLKGMEAGVANAFHVHQVPVQDHLEFPCTGEALGGHFNPDNFDASASPKPATGTPDQYEIGDLSGKYGLLKQQSDMRNSICSSDQTIISLFKAMMDNLI
jgi:Cu/Zn superoxide dismutase